MVTNYGLAAMMNYGRIYLYSGPQPETADSAARGDILGFVSNEGVQPIAGTQTGGLILAQGFEPGTLDKSGNWVVKGTASGLVGWWRFFWNSTDPNTASQYFPRIDGAYGDSFIMESPTITTGTFVSVEAFKLSLPSQ